MKIKGDSPFIQIVEKDLAKFKKLCDKYGIKYKTEEEYVKSAQALCTFVYHYIPPGARTLTTDNKKASKFERLRCEPNHI